MKMQLKGFYFITDDNISEKTAIETVEEALEGQASVIQYRGAGKTDRQMLKESQEIKKKCAKKALFLVDGRVDLAFASGADGVHLEQDDLPVHAARKILGQNKVIGSTVNNLDEVLKMEVEGADYLMVSPIYESGVEPQGKEGIELIREVRENTDLPIAAAGGIDPENVDQVVDVNADMVCSISSTLEADDIASQVKYFSDKFTVE